VPTSGPGCVDAITDAYLVDLIASISGTVLSLGVGAVDLGEVSKLRHS
jgi:hypothetical protein